MNYITLNESNLEKEHICCCISDRKGETCVATKKAWLKARLAEGLVFRRSDTRGKVFIETIPAENACYPIEALGYVHINCFWVSGQYKGQGFANDLLAATVAEAKAQGKLGLTAIASEKKRPFLSDADYLKHKGFQAVDEAQPYFTLYALKFSPDAPNPAFRPCAKAGTIDEPGLALYYTDQCPHTAKYAPILPQVAAERGLTMTLHHVQSREQAQSAPTAMPTYSLFVEGKLVTNEILNDKSFDKLMAGLGKS